MFNEVFKEKVNEIITRHNSDKKKLISIIQDVQKEYHYLPEEVLIYIADTLDISHAKIYGIATFYENFSLNQKGKNIIKVCDGTACHVRKSIPILNAIYKELGLNDEKNTTDDMIFTVETVSCLGACGLAPVITVNDYVYPKMTPEAVIELLNNIKKEEFR
ncbi:complex I 24 kDa subunit family protein [Sedimentibacter sp. MB31-C6]|uniref:complex I 24 kDa subunit family protein n=1 Tax=Sedimentibacter sp. MB31-C6 TaxID=3109366 RepID=UPI002DDCE21A|nr:NAD(P)H-dependent oxidoreductase subunit E [Sedimentibacter sp. MB36-C1]WSI04360.1 NAD(P)H-dependent oxidoreductase subunit E [Sedimentibacter sp. MB36-C1]